MEAKKTNVGGAQRTSRWDLEEYERRAKERAENDGEDPSRDGDVDSRPMRDREEFQRADVGMAGPAGERRSGCVGMGVPSGALLKFGCHANVAGVAAAQGADARICPLCAGLAPLTPVAPAVCSGARAPCVSVGVPDGPWTGRKPYWVSEKCAGDWK